jgi:8-oxo-dGTP pyrophosphatase MutT (NUDIX family)
VTAITLERVRERLSRRRPSRSEEPGAIPAAVALLLAPAASGGVDLLLIKRAEHPGDPWSGQMALPGGRRDPGDFDLLATVIRETLEEVGVRLDPGWLLGELDDLRPRTPTLPPVSVRPFVFGLANRPTIRPSSEVALSVWVSLDELAAGDTRTEAPVLGRGNFPAYRVGEHVVWGMTERIISPFIELVR